MTFRWMLRKNVLNATLESNLIPSWEKAYSNTQCFITKKMQPWTTWTSYSGKYFNWHGRGYLYLITTNLQELTLYNVCYSLVSFLPTKDSRMWATKIKKSSHELNLNVKMGNKMATDISESISTVAPPFGGWPALHLCVLFETNEPRSHVKRSTHKMWWVLLQSKVVKLQK